MPSLSLLRWCAVGLWRMYRREPRTITVTVDPGIPTVGIWCDLCRQHSVVAIPLMTMDDDGVYPLGEWTACMEHEPECFKSDCDD